MIRTRREQPAAGGGSYPALDHQPYPLVWKHSHSRRLWSSALPLRRGDHCGGAAAAVRQVPYSIWGLPRTTHACPGPVLAPEYRGSVGSSTRLGGPTVASATGTRTRSIRSRSSTSPQLPCVNGWEGATRGPRLTRVDPGSGNKQHSKVADGSGSVRRA